MPDVGKLLKMSELFQVSIDYLLKGTEVADHEIQKIEVEKDEASKPDEEEQNKDKKKSKKGIVISLVLTGVLLLACHRRYEISDGGCNDKTV